MIVIYRSTLYGRNRAIVITKSPARVVAAIQITSVRWQSYLLLINTEFGPRRPCVRCTAVRITRLAFIGVVFVPRGLAVWPVRVDQACVISAVSSKIGGPLTLLAVPLWEAKMLLAGEMLIMLIMLNPCIRKI